MANKTATIILARSTKSDLKFVRGDIIAVDGGALFALKNQLKIKVAIGDFDSLPKPKISLLKQQKIPLVHFAKIKDFSDAELAINWVNEQHYETIIIVGFSGKRLDHYQSLLQRVFTLAQSNITLINEFNTITYKGEGNHVVTQGKNSRYFSLFTFDQVSLSLSDAAYPLEKITMTHRDTYTLSNEWINKKPAKLTIHAGGILLFITH
jgi:thiamine pyrophosphokinase